MIPSASRRLKPLFLERAPGQLPWALGFQWFIALQKRTPGSRPGTNEVRFLQAPKSGSWADPFLAAHGSRTYLLFENYNYVRRRGWIECLELDAAGNPFRHGVILDRPYHVSYPFVFQWRGSWFMIPETVEAGRVELYCADEFPWKWKLHRTLMNDVRAADTTVFEKDGRFWLFQTVGTGFRSELVLYHATSPFGPWKPHPMNPVVDSVATGRCGGCVYMEGGVPIRPAQDSDGWYGRRLHLMRVDRLNELEYAESEVGTLEPAWHQGVHALHTYNRCGDWEVWDGAQYGCIPHVLADRVIRRVWPARQREMDPASAAGEIGLQALKCV